jgi:hypothetical protein
MKPFKRLIVSFETVVGSLSMFLKENYILGSYFERELFNSPPVMYVAGL